MYSYLNNDHDSLKYITESLLIIFRLVSRTPKTGRILPVNSFGVKLFILITVKRLTIE